MRGAAILTFLIVAFSYTPGLAAKGPTLRIEILGDGLQSPIVITDPDILGQFSIWNGPGVSMSGPDGELVSLHTDTDREVLDRRFIDWSRGVVKDRPHNLQRVFVTFVIDSARQPGQTRQHQLVYEFAEAEGYIYLPMWRNSLISHGVEGNWMYSTRSWNSVIGSLIINNTLKELLLAERTDPECIVGPAKFLEDGVIEFRYLDENGNKTSYWRYENSTPGYSKVRSHIGEIQHGTSFDLSCWPPRT